MALIEGWEAIAETGIQKEAVQVGVMEGVVAAVGVVAAIGVVSGVKEAAAATKGIRRQRRAKLPYASPPPPLPIPTRLRQ